MPIWVKRIFSGMCLCGHNVDRHHIFTVANQEAYAVIGSRVPGGCLAYGHNEDEGIGPDGEDHCYDYVDKDDPNENTIKSWHGTNI